MMFIRLTLVAALMAFVSATANLRNVVKDSVLSAEEILVDNELVAKAFSSFMKQPQTFKKNIHDKHSKLGKLAIEAKGMKKQNSELMELRKGGGEKYVADGYYVQKIRQNSDCSGQPHAYEGIQLGQCQMVDTGNGIMSVRQTCVNNYDEDMVYELAEVYYSNDCSGEPYQVFPTNQPSPSCSLDLDNYYDNLSFNSKSKRCFPGTKGLDLPPGLIISSHTTSNCQDQPIVYYNFALNTCFEVFDGNTKNLNPKSEYYSMKYTACSDDIIDITIYSDRSCLRPLYKGSIKNHPFHNQCENESDFYMKYSCMA